MQNSKLKLNVYHRIHHTIYQILFIRFTAVAQNTISKILISYSFSGITGSNSLIGSS